ncbi:MAG: FtsX-like permease family protein [Candidatus Bathyarchaeia archaeon]|jgi:putative ABC transport system permease protein
MSETSFSINDLLRRKMQTSLVIFSLTLCVASTLFLLLFAQKMGFGISSAVEGKLTAGFSQMFSPFLTFLVILIIAAGIVMISFTAFIMMSQRIRDIGLMKAAGCPNDLLFGYFFTELLVVGFVGCLAGTILGVLMNMASTSLLNSLGLQFPQQTTSFWTPFAVFIAFFALSLVLGGAPVLSAIRVEPARALSPANYLGLSKESGFKIMSKSGVSLKIAVRSLVRRKSATIRIVLCLSIVFLLVTVGVAGGLIAEDTSRGWVENAVGRNVLLVAYPDMINQYKLLLSEFYEGQKSLPFNYTNEKYLIPSNISSQLLSTDGITGIDARLVLGEPVQEVQGMILGNSTGETTFVGDSRQGESLVVGVDPRNVLNSWSTDGRFLSTNQAAEAVVGDSIGQKLFSEPLIEKIKIFNESLNVVGVCFDPINNGNVTYVPLATLQAISGMSGTNVLMVKIDSSMNETEVLNEVNATVTKAGLEIYELNESADKSVGFLNFLWSTIMFLPLFTLIAASLSLLGYVMLTINEQRQEFGILRALGARPITVLGIVSAQSLIVLLGSYAVGIAFGVITTLLILVQQPIVTTYTVIEIAGWLLLAFGATFASSVYPAIRFAKKPLLETITQS